MTTIFHPNTPSLVAHEPEKDALREALERDIEDCSRRQARVGAHDIERVAERYFPEEARRRP